MQIVSTQLRRLFRRVSARLSRRIVFWSFVSIVAIEGVILMPSAYRRERELLFQLEAISQAKLSAIAQIVDSKPSNQERFNQIKQLELSPDIAGVALYTSSGQQVGIAGETPEITYADITSISNLPIRHKNGSRYDVAQRLSWGGNNYILIVRHDASLVMREFYGFIGRILGLILIISAFVTLVMMIVLERILICPILQLRSDLIRAGEAIRRDKDMPKFESVRVRRHDELGEVITASQQQFQKIRQAIAQVKAAEDALRQSEAKEREKSHQLEQALQDLQQKELQLIQSEKMSSLGQLIAGITHEMNNPIGFIHGNLPYAVGYIQELLKLLQEYQIALPNPPPEIQAKIDAINLNFIVNDLLKILSSMETGTARIESIVKSLQKFSHFDEAGVKTVNIHEEIDNTLRILQHRLSPRLNRPAIQVIKEYGNLPNIECEPGQLNQAFMNILTNAINTLEEKAKTDFYSVGQSNELNSLIIVIRTEFINPDRVAIQITDNGMGMDGTTKPRVFDPFFTKKEVGKGTGLGLWVSYQIVVKNHQGKLECNSTLGQGTEFVIKLPTRKIKREPSSKPSQIKQTI